MKRFTLAMFCAVAVFAIAFTVYFRVEGQQHTLHSAAEGADAPENAVVAFGSWKTNPPLDRFPNDAAAQFPIDRNNHQLTPSMTTIRAGGTVSFIIGGFHVLAIYDDLTQPGDVRTSRTRVPANSPVPPIIDDPIRRIYFGLDPTVLPAKSAQDRIEVVHFDRPGTYLVICAVLPHFEMGMYGFVRVVP